MKKIKFLPIITILILGACIGDDFLNDTVEPVLRITSTVDTIEINTSFNFESIYLNNVGVEEDVEVQWFSSHDDVIKIRENDGVAMALQEGNSVISVNYDGGSTALKDSVVVTVGSETISLPEERSGSIFTTSSYVLRGDFVIKMNGNNMLLEFSDNYAASTALPGLFVYLSNNRNSIANALEISAVEVFSGAHSYTIPNVSINEYSYIVYFCKPFNVKVGDGEII